MVSPTSSGMLARLSQVNQKAALINGVSAMPKDTFIELLDQITSEFEHFLRAIDMINNESLEIMLEQILEAFTLKIGQILEAERTTIFIVDHDKQELWSKIAQGDGERSLEIRVPMGKGISGYVATTMTPSISPTPTRTTASTVPTTRKPATAPATFSVCR
jgi:adenylate cyclase